MTLDKLLTPFRAAKRVYNAIDGFVLKQYVELTESLEEKGKNKNITALKISAAGMGIMLGFGMPELVFNSEKSIHDLDGTSGATIRIFAYVIPAALDLVDSLYNIVNPENSATSEEKAVDPIKHFSKNLLRKVRLPTLGIGLYHIYRSAEFLFSSTVNTWDTIGTAVIGCYSIAVASSMYIKDNDQRLLKKEPVRSRIRNYLFPPKLVPAPVDNRNRRYQALNYCRV